MRIRLPGFLLIVVPILQTLTLRGGVLAAGDWLYVGLLAAHMGCGVALIAGVLAPRRPAAPRRSFLFLLYRAPEALIVLCVVFFLFLYIFATNANMDYVQRFIASGGNLRLAPNSTQERLTAVLKLIPLLVSDLLALVLPRLASHVLAAAALRASKRVPAGIRVVRAWALPMSLLSALLYALSFPSFLDVDGLPALAYVCLIPLLVVFRTSSVGWGIFYGTSFAVVQTMVVNYWLGTFNLVSLQFATAVILLEYLPFLWITLLILRRSGKLGFLLFPAAWTFFDFLRSMGFLGYPWGMLGTSQYAFTPLIQTASLTGVWGITFLVTLCNSAAAEAIMRAVSGKKRGLAPYITAAVAFIAAFLWGGARIAAVAPTLESASTRSVRLALIQQNGDPRKDDYRNDFNTLRLFTDEALKARPDIVVWSETAFVPNIRRWSAEDPAKEPLAALVRDFLAYQKRTGQWLVTGNDDYELVSAPEGSVRYDYNAAVLFSPAGARIETYHKIHLVPFTEYFPYKKELPGIYRLLTSFDVYLWEPGKTRVVFRHPLFTFSTPICFEDVFPSDVRDFVNAGAAAIVNLSNDYWSLTEVEAMQHAANGLFRAVENGKPLARASASGLTCLVDPLGRIRARAPFNTKAFLTVDMKIPELPRTLYTRWGDWFPIAMGVLVLAIFIAGLIGWDSGARAQYSRGEGAQPRLRIASRESDGCILSFIKMRLNIVSQ